MVMELLVNAVAAVMVLLLLLLLLVVRRVHCVDGGGGAAHGTRGCPSPSRRGRIRGYGGCRCPLVVRLGRLGTDDGRDSGRVGLASDVFGVGQLVVLFVLHPSILEPDFDLPFCQTKLVCHLYPPPPGEVVVRVELLLQL